MATPKSKARDQAGVALLATWANDQDVDLARLDVGQQWIIFAALELIAFLGAVTPLKRLVGYFLAHCGMDLGTKTIAALVGTTDRAVRQTKALAAPEVLRGLRERGHRKAKLQAKHAGIVAKFLAARPNALAPEILAHIKSEIGVEIDRLTLRRYLERYGLGCLRRDDSVQPTPLFSAPHGSEARSS